MIFFKKTKETDFARKLDAFIKAPISDIMTKKIMHISPDDNLMAAANIMIGHHVSSLIVMELGSKKPIGIITERDFLLKAPTDESKLKKFKVKDIMTKNPVSIQPNLPVMDANEIMNEHKFRKLIVTEEKKVVGIVTQTDLVRFLDRFYQEVHFRTSDSLSVKAAQWEAYSLDINSPVNDAHKKMVKDGSGTVFVKDDKSVVGMFTEYDFLSELALQPEKVKKQKLGDVMSFPVVAIDADVDLFDANHLMIEKNFRRLPVMESEKVTGKITQTTVREAGYNIIKKSVKRIKNNELDKVSFTCGKPKELVRKIHGKLQRFTYA